MYFGVLCVRQVHFILVLFGQAFRNAMREADHDYSAGAVDLAVGLGLRGSRGQISCSQTYNGCQRELGPELQSVFRQRVGVETVQNDSSTQKPGENVPQGYSSVRYGLFNLVYQYGKKRTSGLPYFVSGNRARVSIGTNPCGPTAVIQIISI